MGVIMIDMVKEVIKKSGKKQKFSSTKIKRSIELAAQEANLPPSLRQKIARKITADILLTLEDFDVVTTGKIRDAVLEQLDREEPAVLKAWLAYEIRKIRKKTQGI